MAKISIVVISCGNLKLTIPCLEHILKATYNSAQVILVDNGSAPDCKVKLKNFCEEFLIDFVSLEKNFGPGIGRSKGLEVAKSDFVAFVDDDIIVTESWDVPLLNKLISSNNIGQVSSIMAENNLTHPFFLGRDLRQVWDSAVAETNIFEAINVFTGSRPHLEFISELNKVNLLPEYENVIAPPDAIGGGCFMIKKAIVEKVGGIADPNFISYGNEDIDLSWRIGISGAEIYRSNHSYVHHFRHGGSEFLYSKEQRKSLLKTSNDYFISKWWEIILKQIPITDLENWKQEKRNWFLVMILEKVMERKAK